MSPPSLLQQLREILDDKGIEYREFIVGEDISGEELTKKIGKPALTVPQIFLDGEYIGGYTDLVGRLGVSG